MKLTGQFLHEHRQSFKSDGQLAPSQPFNPYPAKQIAVCFFLVCFNFQSALMSLKIGEMLSDCRPA